MRLGAEILRALWSMALPVSVFSLGLVWWAVSRGYLRGEGGVSGVNREFKALSKERKKFRKEHKKLRKKRGGKGHGEAPDTPPAMRKFDPVQEKLMKFGGGFYGVVAFYTYVVVEWNEIVDFITNFGGFMEMLRQISPEAVIGLLLNSIMNFVIAIAWPVYWINSAIAEFFWVWFVAAYLGYWLGVKVALRAAARKWGHDWLPLPGQEDEES